MTVEKKQPTPEDTQGKQRQFSNLRDVASFFYPETEGSKVGVKGGQRGTEAADRVFREITKEPAV